MEITVNTNILWVVFFILLMIFAFFIPVFNYHWDKYGVSDRRKFFAKIIYYGVTSIILFFLLIFIYIFSKTNVI